MIIEEERIFIYPYCVFVFVMGSLLQVLKINPEKKHIDSFVATDFDLIGYVPHKKIEMKMAV